MNDKKITPIDAMLLVLILGLSSLGLVMLLSASSIMAEKDFADPYFFFRPQLRNMLLGLAIMFIISQVPYQLWPRLAYPLWIICLIALGLALIPGFGREVNGANRWLNLPGFAFQPSETAKLAIVVYLAYSLSRKGAKAASFFYGLAPHILVLVPTVALIYIEPDLGTSISVVLIAFIMIFVAGTKIWHLTLVAGTGAALAYGAILTSAFRLRRMAAFMDPWADPQGSGYHIIHSFYAFASGGLWGLGPGASQQKLFFLPEPHTDFIFSVLAEEAGLAGVSVIALLFLLLVGRGLTISLAAREFSGRYLALGAALIVAVPAFFNMAVVTALIPTKGLPLPFFSYGGTNLLVCYAAMGILLNVAGQSQGERPKIFQRLLGAGRLSRREAS